MRVLTVAGLLLGVASTLVAGVEETRTIFEANLTAGSTQTNLFNTITSKIWNDNAEGCVATAAYYWSDVNQSRFFFNTNDTSCRTALEGMAPSAQKSELLIDQLVWRESQYAKPTDPSQWEFKIEGGGDTGLLLVRPSSTSTWGTVCDDYFSNAEAAVVCQSMGFNVQRARAEFYTSGGSYGNRPIYMDDVQCGSYPNATSLADCSFVYSTEFARNDNCGHYEDVAVDCRGPPTTNPADWELRLASTELGVGRLEMRPDNSSEWGTVCDDTFDANAALAACRMLGYTNITHAFALNYYGGGTGTIYLDQVSCPEGAESLADCTYDFSTAESRWNDCSHYEDVAIDCRGVVPTNDAPIIGFTATLNLTVQSPQATMDRIAAYYFTNVDRLAIIDVSPADDDNITTMQFRFLDPPLDRWFNDIPRDRLDYYLLSVDRQGVFRAFGVNYLTSNSTRDERPTTWDFIVTGSSPYAGLLTVRPNSTATWGTVCDDYFDATAALAACKSAGFTNATRATVELASSARHNTGSGPIYMDNVICPVNATNLMNCTYIYSTVSEISHDCTHMEDVTINCFPDGNQPYYQPPAESWQYKIEGGGTTGLLVVRPSAVSPWGTVCDDYFTHVEALVVCRAMGYNITKARAKYYSGGSSSQYGSSPIYMDDVHCEGTGEGITAGLGSCAYTYSTEFVQRSNCAHYEDVAVDCNGPPETDPNQWQFRLVGEEIGMGRLEMRPDNNSEWGTVCDDNFDANAALAACHSLGFTNATYGIMSRGNPGTGPIYLDEVNCSNGATRLQDCTYDFSTADDVWNNCFHWEDVSLDCRGTAPTNDAPIVGYIGTINVTVQSAEETMGRIAEYFFVDADRLWIYATDGPDANNVTTLQFRFLDPAIPDWYLDRSRNELDYFFLAVNRASIDKYFGLLTLTSNSTRDQRPTTWDFVITGSSPYAGLLTVRPNSTVPWGTVCDDHFDLTAALTACKSIFGDNATRATLDEPTDPSHNTGTGPIYMDNVICPVNATNLMNCTYIYSTVSEINHDCTHREDVTINCFPDGNQPYYQPPAESWEYQIDGGGKSGLLVVRPSAVSPWGTVCDDSFTGVEALVTCRMMGYNITKAKANYYSGNTKYNTAPIYLDDVKCGANPSGTNLFDDCSYVYSTEFVKRHNCNHLEDVEIDCRGPPPTNPDAWELRLVESQPGLGRLEIKPDNNSDWGTVCDDDFDNKAALAACRSLGYTNITHAFFVQVGGGTGTIYLDQVNCSNGAERLQDCAYDFSTAEQRWNDCSHFEDVGVDCRGIVPSNNANIIGFTATINVTQQSAEETIARVASSMFVGTDRLWLTDVQPPAEGSVIATIQFRFLDPTIANWNTAVARDTLDTRLIAYDSAAVTRVMGIIKLTNNRTAYQTQFEVRLSTTGFHNVGRVEVRPISTDASATGEWGTVCGDWRLNQLAAASICRSAGFDVEFASLLYPSANRAGTGPIYLSEVTCDAYSTFLGNCTYAVNSNSCAHSQDAWVQCGKAQQPKDLKFKLDPSPATVAPNAILDSGLLRVQLYPEGPWDYVCSYSLIKLRSFSADDAMRACRALGFNNVRTATIYRPTNLPSSPTYGLANLDCPSGATNLTECSTFYDSRNMNGGNCLLGSPVAIDCNMDSTDSWEYRLVAEHASKPMRGRFEMRPSDADAWGTVCSDDFDDFAARYACKAVGMPTDKAYAIKWYGQSNNSAPIYLDNVRCLADSNDLTNCSYLYSPPGTARHNCQHWEDVGIDCTGTGRQPLPPLGFTALTEGNGDEMIEKLAWWFYVDTDRFVVYNNVSNGTEPFSLVSFYITERADDDDPFYTTRTILETGLLNLPADSRLDYTLIIRLTNNASEAIKPTMAFRLQSGADDSVGRLEVRPDDYSAWGTMCDDGFDANAANAVCHSLGFPFGGQLIDNKPYNDVVLHIYLDDSDCRPEDYFYQNCSFTYSTVDRNVGNCMAHENVALQCFTAAPTTTSSSATTTDVAPTTTATATDGPSTSTAPVTTSVTGAPATTTTSTPIVTTAPVVTTTVVPTTSVAPATTVTSITSAPVTTSAPPATTAKPTITARPTTPRPTAAPTPAPTRRPSGVFVATLTKNTVDDIVFRSKMINFLGIDSTCYEAVSYTTYNRTVQFRFVDGGHCDEDPSAIAARLNDAWAKEHDRIAAAVGIETLSAPAPSDDGNGGGGGLVDIIPIAIGAGVGCVVIIGVVVGIVIWRRSKRVGEEEERYDEDYIAMNDYRQSAI